MACCLYCAVVTVVTAVVVLPVLYRVVGAVFGGVLAVCWYVAIPVPWWVVCWWRGAFPVWWLVQSGVPEEQEGARIIATVVAAHFGQVRPHI